MVIIKLVIFLVVSLGITALSWKSLRQPHSHGFPRFFAFEFILMLILLNIDYWFREPFSISQIISWILLVSSMALAIHGFYLLHKIGKPASGIEDTTILIIKGAYKYIRHPLYSSLLLFAWGTFFKDFSILSLILVLMASIFIILTAKFEENENLARFGDDYVEYLKTTRLFIPFLF
jgi:protein-S-isoprenylcysteine O-methyltransferase Ste14